MEPMRVFEINLFANISIDRQNETFSDTHLNDCAFGSHSANRGQNYGPGGGTFEDNMEKAVHYDVRRYLRNVR